MNNDVITFDLIINDLLDSILDPTREDIAASIQTNRDNFYNKVINNSIEAERFDYFVA
jgi:hypothetical protein